MNKTKKSKPQGWVTSVAGIQNLRTPLATASVHYEKDCYRVTIYGYSTTKIQQEFKDADEAKTYAVDYLKKTAQRSLDILNQL